MKEKFLLGFNYWASHAGLYMWRLYNFDVVEKDLRLLSTHGVNTIRIFPLWPDFQPLTDIRFCNAKLGSYCYRLQIYRNGTEKCRI